MLLSSKVLKIYYILSCVYNTKDIYRDYYISQEIYLKPSIESLTCQKNKISVRNLHNYINIFELYC